MAASCQWTPQKLEKSTLLLAFLCVLKHAALGKQPHVIIYRYRYIDTSPRFGEGLTFLGPMTKNWKSQLVYGEQNIWEPSGTPVYSACDWSESSGDPGVVGQVMGQLWKQNTVKDVEAVSTFCPGRDLVLTWSLSSGPESAVWLLKQQQTSSSIPT